MFQSQLLQQRLQTFGLSSKVDVQSSTLGPIISMDLDKVEDRFLLVGSAIGMLAVYDLEYCGNIVTPSLTNKESVSSLSSRPMHTHDHSPCQLMSPIVIVPAAPLSISHQGTISSVKWYGFDCGMFFTGGLDGNVKIWDMTMLRGSGGRISTINDSCVHTFLLNHQVYGIDSIHPSSTIHHHSSMHSLIATATESPFISLCDVATGTSSQILSGHQSAVWCVCWSPINSFHLFSGGVDGRDG